MSDTAAAAPPKPDPLQKTEGFFARHWKLLLFIGLCVLCTPLLTAIVQIIVALAKPLEGIEKAIADCLGKFAQVLQAIEKECQENPNGWKCILVQIAIVVLPVMDFIYTRFGGRKGKGTAEDTVEQVAAMEDKPKRDLNNDIATGAREDAEAVLRELSPELQANPKVQEAVMAKELERRTSAEATAAAASASDLNEKKAAEAMAQAALDRGEAAMEDALKDESEETKDTVRKALDEGRAR